MEEQLTGVRSAQARSFRAGLAHQFRPSGTTGWSLLLLDVLPDDRDRCTAAGGGEVAGRPQVPVHAVPVHPAGELVTQPSGGDAFETDSGVDMQGVRVGPRPRPQRRQEHTRGRTGRESKRLRRGCQSSRLAGSEPQ